MTRGAKRSGFHKPIEPRSDGTEVEELKAKGDTDATIERGSPTESPCTLLGVGSRS